MSQPHDPLTPAVAQVEAAAQQSGLRLSHEFYVALVSAFIEGVQSPQAESFLSLLREQVDLLAPGRDQSSAWQATIAVLHWAVIATLADADQRIAPRFFFRRQAACDRKRAAPSCPTESRLKRHYMISHAIGRLVNEAENFGELADVIFREFPRLDIQACYVCIYEGNKADATLRLQCFGFNRQDALPPQLYEMPHSSQQVLPAEFGSGA